MQNARPNNAEELKATIRATWALITPEQCQKLIDSMPRRINAVIEAKGAPTKAAGVPDAAVSMADMEERRFAEVPRESVKLMAESVRSGLSDDVLLCWLKMSATGLGKPTQVNNETGLPFPPMGGRSTSGMRTTSQSVIKRQKVNQGDAPHPVVFVVTKDTRALRKHLTQSEMLRAARKHSPPCQGQAALRPPAPGTAHHAIQHQRAHRPGGLRWGNPSVKRNLTPIRPSCSRPASVMCPQVPSNCTGVISDEVLDNQERIAHKSL
ncbi:hypothetical protein J4Q44_G00379740 [Coregonus suidteri]|uniref:Uncharacterized protein n=1 Tax=Coregonus suidteri TaxID=861788 RepID=A0AAN8Q5A7_9TELE